MLAWFRAHKPDEFLKALGLYAAPPKSADTTDVPCYIDEAPFL
jgi:hypothetical protein